MTDLKPQNKASMAAYMAALPEDRAAALERVRQAVHRVIPGLSETMAYGMPTFEREGTGPLLAIGFAVCLPKSLHVRSGYGV